MQVDGWEQIHAGVGQSRGDTRMEGNGIVKNPDGCGVATASHGTCTSMKSAILNGAVEADTMRDGILRWLMAAGPSTIKRCCSTRARYAATWDTRRSPASLRQLHWRRAPAASAGGRTLAVAFGAAAAVTAVVVAVGLAVCPGAAGSPAGSAALTRGSGLRRVNYVRGRNTQMEGTHSLLLGPVRRRVANTAAAPPRWEERGTCVNENTMPYTCDVNNGGGLLHT